MTRFILLFFYFLFTMTACQQKKDTSMSLQDEGVIVRTASLSARKWNRLKGKMYIDTLNLYKGKNSLHLVSTEQDSQKEIYAWYAYDLSEVEGDILSVNGKYKLEKAEEAEIYFKIQQYDHIDKVDSIIIPSTEVPEWKDFIVKVPIDEYSDRAVLYIIGKGDIDILLSDCEAWIDNTPLSAFIDRKFAAESDNEFDKGSHIKLGELTPQMLENLEVLGRVWGFLKYYHPEITQGKYNWDYELFRVIPEIANARDKRERDRLINRWIDKYGAIKETSSYIIADSTRYTRFIDLSWLENRTFFNEEIVEKLQHIKNSTRSKKLNYYISLNAHDNFLLLEREKSYKNIIWDDQGFRILTLFRMWNLIEYCFPYTNYTDASWDTLLKKFLPAFVSPEDQASYELAILQLGANIDDSHGHILIPNNRLYETVLTPIYARNRVPVELIQSEEGYIVVKSSESEFLRRGDIIVSIEGRDINDIIEEMSPYIIASNKNGLIRNLLYYLLSSQSGHLHVDVLRDEKKIGVHIRHFRRSAQPYSVKSLKEYNLDKRNIIYVDNIKITEENKAIIRRNMNSEGLIIDMRVYPNFETMNFVASLISLKYPLWISENDKSYPGNYRVKFGYDKINEPEKESNYKGKIVILVDENTQSAGETWAMSYRLAPNSMIIGRQTAGANGPVCRIPLPGNAFFIYTWNGAYYPNWEILQRKGVKIDIPVSPTVDDIKLGRDVWIEKAIEVTEK